MSDLSSMRVKDMYFKHQDIARINVKSIFDLLRCILLHLKANASSIPSTLGGRGLKFVEVIISEVAYTILAPMFPFVDQVRPGILVVFSGATRYEIMLTKYSIKHY